MLQTVAVGLLMISAVLPDVTADAGAQLRALKQFGGEKLPPHCVVPWTAHKYCPSSCVNNVLVLADMRVKALLSQRNIRISASAAACSMSMLAGATQAMHALLMMDCFCVSWPSTYMTRLLV